jgi:hypothetical protein
MNRSETYEEGVGVDGGHAGESLQKKNLILKK